MTKQFYLRDIRSNTGTNASFWAKAGSYTTNLNDAEVFTEEKALRQHKCRETDLPVSVEFVAGKTRQRIDMQHLDTSPTLRDADQHVVVVQGEYDGNDVLFIGNSSFHHDFDRAAVFTLEEACELAAKNSNYRIYPYDDVAAIVRITVDAIDVRPKDCAAFAGFTLIEPSKPQKEVYRCCGCGVFMSQYQYYASDCRKCGTSNRP
jgi:hypothetical protein